MKKIFILLVVFVSLVFGQEFTCADRRISNFEMGQIRYGIMVTGFRHQGDGREIIWMNSEWMFRCFQESRFRQTRRAYQRWITYEHFLPTEMARQIRKSVPRGEWR